MFDITEHSFLKKALWQNQGKLGILFNNLNDLIIMCELRDNNSPGRIIEVNDTTCECLEYSRDELIKMCMEDICIPQDQTKIAEFIKSLTTDSPITIKCALLSKDGVRIPAEVDFHYYAIIKKMVVIAIARDISEHMKTKEALEVSEQNYRTIFNAVNDGILVLEMDTGKIIDANQQVFNMFDYTREEFWKLSLEDLSTGIFPYNNENLLNKRAQAIKDEPQLFEWLAHDKNGNKFWVEVNLKRTIIGDKNCLLAVIRDISKRKKAEERLKQSIGKMHRLFRETTAALASVVEIRDPYTAGHQRDVARLAYAIAREMKLPEEQVEGLVVAGNLHDIGKIQVPAEILSKPGKLTPAEFVIIKTHCQAGYDILKMIEFPWPVAEILLQHHEKLDGSGYPHGLKGEEILLEARILTVADVVDAMASHRPYRPSLGLDKAMQEIANHKGILYDPQVVDACLKIFKEKTFSFN